MATLGLYLHIPFCRSKCHYCDFCSMPRADGETVAAYVRAMQEDLVKKAPACRAYTVDTVYFGGGTPTCLSARQLSSLLETVKAEYHLLPDAEITLECNPATGSYEDFLALRRAGFNRMSIGLQSAHKNELRALGRLHDFDGFLRTWEAAVRAGFTNLSADVMQGIPEQTRRSYLETLTRLVSVSPSHISAYALSVEEGTNFGNRRDSLILPDEEETRAMYMEGSAFLARHGYAQYEISNFARKGYRSRHNLKYWSCEEYLGFGPAAYSFFGGERFGNSRDVEGYIKGMTVECEREAVTLWEAANEYVMLRMRLCEGVSASAFEARFGSGFREGFGKALETFVPTGLVARRGDGYAFTPEGMYVSNAILSEILDF